MRVIIHHVTFGDYASFIFPSGKLETALRTKRCGLQGCDWWIVKTVMCLNYKSPHLIVERKQYCRSQLKLLPRKYLWWQPCFHIILSPPSRWDDITHESLLSVWLPIPVQWWGSLPAVEPVASFNPPAGHYQPDVNIKVEPIYKSVFVLGNRLPFQGHKRRWSRPRTTHLTRNGLPQGLSIRHCHKRAFLPATSCRYCPSLLP